MSWLSSGLRKLGKGAKKLVTDPGDWIQNIGKDQGKLLSAAAPALKFIPGVGQIAAPLAGAWGSVLQGKNMQSHLQGALSNVGLPGMGSIPGVGGVIKNFSGSIPGLDQIGGGGGGGFLGGLKKIGGDIFNKIGGLDGLLAIGSGIQGFDAQRKSDRYMNHLIDMANPRHAETAGLRSQGLAGLSKPDALPDVSSLFASDAGNPYSNRFKKVRPV